jgi:hypothetical protein
MKYPHENGYALSRKTGFNLSRVTIIIAAFLLSMIVCFMSACLRSLPKELEGYTVNYPLQGKWQDGSLKGKTYTNNGFGFSFVIPQDWYITEPDIDSSTPKPKKDNYDLLSIEKVADTSIGRIITITFRADPIFNYKDQWVKGAQMYLFTNRDTKSRQNEEPGFPMYEDMGYAETDSIHGKRFYSYDFKVVLDSTDNHYLQKDYASLFDSIILNVQICYLNESEKEEIIRALESTQWKKKVDR